MSRPRTSYNICHPPPKTSARSKIHVRAKPLLQLHKHAASGRPMPAFELLPSAIFSPSLSRAIGKVFRPKHGLCPADLAIVAADSYHHHEEADEDETRDVLALICKGRKGDAALGKARIFLQNTSEWEAYSLPNGGYEFSSTDEHGLITTARWVQKRPRARRSQSASELESARVESKKFTFSTISSSTRRHPIIANLTSTTLDVNDYYHIPSAVSSALGQPEDSPPLADPIGTTAALHTLITATAIWVALREGWSPGYRYEDHLMRSPSSKHATSPAKTASDLSNGAKDSNPRRSGSVARMLRTAGASKRRSASAAPTDGSSDDVVVSRNSSLRSTAGPTRRPRAESASTVIHNRTTWPRPDMYSMRRNTAASNVPHGFGTETGEDMTEEEQGEGEDDDGEQSGSGIGSPIVTPSKRTSLPKSLAPSPEPKTEPTTSIPEAHRRKRESSATDMTLEAKRAEAGLPTKRRSKRSRFFKALMCGMA